MNQTSIENQESVKPNWALLSLMRFVLAGIVLVAHLGIVAPGHALMPALSLGSFAAVMGFFSISGFSIAHSLGRNREGYMKRRFWRIYPTFFVAVLLSLVPFLLAGVVTTPGLVCVPPEPLQFILNFVPAQSVLTKAISTNGPLWSLGVEECFYLLAPMLAFTSARVIAVMVFASAALYCFGPNVSGIYAGGSGAIGPLALAWAWLLGWLVYTTQNPILRGAAILVPCVCISLNNQYGGGLSVLTVGVVALLLTNQGAFVIPEKWSAACDWLGNLSFPLYVLHFPVYIIAYQLTQSASVFVYLAAALVVSVAVLHAVDIPLRRRGLVNRPLGVKVGLNLLSERVG